MTEATVRVVLPTALRDLIRSSGAADPGADVRVTVAGPATWGRVLAALETRYPMLRGTLRDQATGARRPLIRFFACGTDVSHTDADQPLPDPVQLGHEPLLIVTAVAGG
jgi:molybdopterin synthase sulfur carrier subunit